MTVEFSDHPPVERLTAVDPDLGLGALRPFSDLKATGLLWLINTAVFHPRGYAIGLHFTDRELGEVDGWVLFGDGSEPWVMGETPVDERPDGYRTIDELFTLTKELLK